MFFRGTEIASNNDGAAPGETVGFDSYLRYTFALEGTTENTRNLEGPDCEGLDDF